jgi:septal ring factor EnvC (AmiA/AmiB activator)
MTIIERTLPYETMIRHNADGTIGAHHLTINEVVRDGEVIAAQISQALPLAGPDVEAAVGQALPAAMSQIASLQAELSAKTAQTQSLERIVGEQAERLAAAKARIDELETALAGAAS